MLDVAKGKFNPEKVEGIKAVWRVMGVFFFTLAYWIVWDQNLSEWVLQSNKMDRVINFGFVKYEFIPGQIQITNAIFLLIFIPIFNYWIYPSLDKIGLKTTLLRRFGAGLVLTALSFVVIALIQTNIDHGGRPTLWWQVFAYVLLSAAEVLVSITGLEYAYKHSPKSMKSTMTAIFLMVVALGNVITGLINSNISQKGFLAPYMVGANFYWCFVGMIAVFAVAFMFISPHMKERNYIDEPDDEPVTKNEIIADTDNV